MEAVFNVTGLFAPMIYRRGGTIDYPGGEALDIVVPHLGSLPWEAVMDFRDHQGSCEARALRLRVADSFLLHRLLQHRASFS